MKRKYLKQLSVAPGFMERAKQWAANQTPCMLLDSHSGQGYSYPDGVTYDVIIAAGVADSIRPSNHSFEALKTFHSKHRDWLFGHLSYDLKNELEDLESNNHDGIDFPAMHFFRPEILLIFNKGELTLGYCEGYNPEEVLEEITRTEFPVSSVRPQPCIQARISHAEYLKGVMSFLHHIAIGDIYEANFCQEFYAENVELNPFGVYTELAELSPTPFGAFYRTDNRFLMCASPERFIKKSGNRVISQPIKGTIHRSENKEEDLALKEQLRQSEKDRSENVMIVDLVRNDLSRSAAKGSVHVSELCGVYTFPNVHQMISTIASEVKKGVHFTEVLKSAFPMGSMTGAPKIMAMNLIEKYEQTKRGLYSGSVGYISPSGDFDFNVVIRSVLYNAENRYLSYSVGGAITSKSDPESEYEETHLKAWPLLKVLS